MNICIVGKYSFDVIGDGMHDTMDIPLEALHTPDPVVDGQMPIEAMNFKPPGTTGIIEGNILHLHFDVPPSAAKVTFDALFGKKE